MIRHLALAAATLLMSNGCADPIPCSNDPDCPPGDLCLSGRCSTPTEFFTVVCEAVNGSATAITRVGECSGPACVVPGGGSVVISASPNPGFRFVEFAGPGCVDADPSTPSVLELTSITANLACEAVFESL